VIASTTLLGLVLMWSQQRYRIYSIVSRGFQSYFFSISCGIYLRAAYIFCFFTLSKGVDDAQSFLGYILSTSLYVFTHSILFRIKCTLRHRRYYDEQEAAAAMKHHYQGDE